MTKVLSLDNTRADRLTRRHRIAIDLPEFALQALEYRRQLANEEAEPEDASTLNDVIEWYVISPLTVREIPHIEAAVPGFGQALARWIFESTYRPPEE